MRISDWSSDVCSSDLFFVGFGCVPGGSVDRRADGTGRDGVDANALWRQLLRQSFHHHVDAALGGGVIDMAGSGDALVYRTHADDLAGGARDLRHHDDRKSCG